MATLDLGAEPEPRPPHSSCWGKKKKKTLTKVVSIGAQLPDEESARASPASLAPSLCISQSCSRKCDREQMASLALGAFPRVSVPKRF